MPIRRRRRYSSQEVDVERSFSVENEGYMEGYYIGLVGAILKYFMTILAGLLLIATQTEPSATFFILMLVVFYVAGWIMTREAGFKTLTTYDTLLDVLAYGMTFGFLIRVVESVVLRISTGVLELDILSPFESFLNSSLLPNGVVMTAVGLTFASVAEEMLHRGGMIYLSNLLADRQGMSTTIAKTISLFVQAGTFAILHSAVYQKPEQITALFAGGIIFGLILYWKKDLSVCIVAHLTVNLSALTPHFANFLIENPIVLVGVVASVGLLLLLFSCRSGGGGDTE